MFCIDQVTAWAKGHEHLETLRSIDGIKDIEVSFCPGEGWLAARYIFNDLDGEFTRKPPRRMSRHVAVVTLAFLVLAESRLNLCLAVL